jgi:hypothetical protein
MQEKINQVSQYWNEKPTPFPGYGDIDPAVIRPFKGTHPAIVSDWLKTDAEWEFTPNPNYRLTKRDKKVRLKLKIEEMFGLEISKKHYTDLDK